MSELIRIEANEKLAFGDHTLEVKTKVSDFNFQNDLYYVKSFREITKLEKNSAFVYESNPGTTVREFSMSSDEVNFLVEAAEDVQITLGLLEDTVYEVFVDGEAIGGMKTNMSGKLSVSLECNSGKAVYVRVLKN